MRRIRIPTRYEEITIPHELEDGTEVELTFFAKVYPGANTPWDPTEVDISIEVFMNGRSMLLTEETAFAQSRILGNRKVTDKVEEIALERYYSERN